MKHTLHRLAKLLLAAAVVGLAAAAMVAVNDVQQATPEPSAQPSAEVSQ